VNLAKHARADTAVIRITGTETDLRTGAPAGTKISTLSTADDLRKRIAFDYLTVGGSRANLEALAGGRAGQARRLRTSRRP
jgi:hypothetical protein